jgi:ribosome-associated toxin RatA of RatAB toxin-antitoxin module
MAQAEIHEVLPVDAEKLYSVVTRYEDYPKFVEGCTSAEVERKDRDKIQVRYQVSMMKDISYTLEHSEDPASGRASWTLVESDVLKKNTGSWEVKSLGAGKCDVHYQVEIEFKIPVPGFVLSRLIKGSLPAMIKNFQERAKKS